MVIFSAPLWRWPTPNGVLMVTVPENACPPALAAVGRTPIRATVCGRTWPTSIFWGDLVEVALKVDMLRSLEQG